MIPVGERGDFFVYVVKIVAQKLDRTFLKR